MLRKEKLETPTPEQMAKGHYQRRYVTHVEDNTKAMAHVSNSNIVEKWFTERRPGFEEPARLAINWCHKCWEARGVIGSISANYEPIIGGGSPSQFARDVELKDELDEVKAWFPKSYWRVFENVVRWGLPAGYAGSELAENPAQAIASARTTVALVANFIAMKRGY